MKTAAVFAVVAFAAGAHAQTGMIDQASPVVGASFNLSSTTLTWQQQIRAGVDGQLEGIEIRTLGPAGAECFVRLRVGEAWSLQPPLFDAMIAKATPDAEMIFIDVTSAASC